MKECTEDVTLDEIKASIDGIWAHWHGDNYWAFDLPEQTIFNK
jgi:hypothetical protein